MPSSTCCAVAAPGACCPMSFRPGPPCIGTFVGGSAKASGSGSCIPYVCRCVSSKAETLNPAPRFSTVNRSKRARFVAHKRATIRGKKVWGRKRHVLVDTQGHLLAIKVTGADSSDQQGAKALLERVRAVFPAIKLLWGDSHYAGQLITWLKVHLGWSVQIVRRLKVPQRGLLVPRSAPRSSGIACFRQGFNRCPDDGWSNAPSPGSSGGVASAAIMRACLRVPRLSSRSRRPDACSRCSLLSSRKRWQPDT
jgi:transposase